MKTTQCQTIIASFGLVLDEGETLHYTDEGLFVVELEDGSLITQTDDCEWIEVESLTKYFS